MKILTKFQEFAEWPSAFCFAQKHTICVVYTLKNSVGSCTWKQITGSACDRHDLDQHLHPICGILLHPGDGTSLRKLMMTRVSRFDAQMRKNMTNSDFGQPNDLIFNLSSLFSPPLCRTAFCYRALVLDLPMVLSSISRSSKLKHMLLPIISCNTQPSRWPCLQLHPSSRQLCLQVPQLRRVRSL